MGGVDWAPLGHFIPQGERPRALCQVVGCKSFATTEVKKGLYDSFKAMCPTHRRQWGNGKAFAFVPKERRRISAPVQ